jgi:hypothetical protein
VATVDKDFKVKNGLIVANGGSFGGAVTVDTPTLDMHAATKQYVDQAIGNSTMTVGSTAPSSPTNGQQWLDTLTERVYVYYNSTWVPQASLADAETLQDHIHDTSIDGNGLIVSVIVEGGFYNSAGVLTDAGTYDLTSWNALWDGGIAIDNFN